MQFSTINHAVPTSQTNNPSVILADGHKYSDIYECQTQCTLGNQTAIRKGGVGSSANYLRRKHLAPIAVLWNNYNRSHLFSDDASNVL